MQDLPESVGRGGWSEFSRLLAISRREYREFLTELGFGPLLGIPYVSVYHPSVGCFVERFFHHTGTFHLSTCEMAVLPVDWSAILGIRFGGRAPPSEPISSPEAREILGLDDPDAIDGTRLPSVRVRYLADILRRDREEPPTELRYRQWAAYFIFSCFLGNDKSTIPTPIVGMFRDIDALREYDLGALTYGLYIRGLRRYSRREYREFLTELGFGPFLGISYVSVYHPSVGCFVERFFHHTGTFHLSSCEMAVLPVDWSAILGIRFGGRAPPGEPIFGPEAREILGLDDHDAIDGSRSPSVRVRYLADILRRDREEPPTELRYRQWAVYFIFSCFLGNDKSTVPTPIVGMFRDVDTLREYEWGSLTYGFYIRGLCRFSRWETINFLGFWQFTIF